MALSRRRGINVLDSFTINVPLNEPESWIDRAVISGNWVIQLGNDWMNRSEEEAEEAGWAAISRGATGKVRRTLCRPVINQPNSRPYVLLRHGAGVV